MGIRRILRVLSELANRLNGSATPAVGIARTNGLSPHDYNLARKPLLK